MVREAFPPLSELLEDNAVWESLSADANSLQDSVTPQLVQNQVRLQFTSLQENRDIIRRRKSKKQNKGSL